MPNLYLSRVLSLFVFLFQSLASCDPVNVRNARSAMIEALPQVLSSMALLWGALMKEEFQKRTIDSAHSSRHSPASVYFKSTKVGDTDVRANIYPGPNPLLIYTYSIKDK